MKNNQYIRQAQYKKGFANVFFSVVILILIGTIGAFVLNNVSDWKIYQDFEYGFEFKYPKDEKVEIVGTYATLRNTVGQKIISVSFGDSNSSGNNCLQHIDVRCSNITADGFLVMRFYTSGYIDARANLLNGKYIFFSLSCDSLTEWTPLKDNYCIISEQRKKMFENLLSTFKLTEPFTLNTSNWKTYRDDNV